ncbi:hypothetical protein IEQ34_002005 [Dendrobium chrysotoxum]|uniref:Symplekin C-terminal domain-containing protein n=1 Tax=Dendrobium chrysotoxum TaxID=161865 RepID=A0AAV7HM82_DENCH|nr:hypothetical protein IEQ34_002005 [Dendrobium chrysotoxum]
MPRVYLQPIRSNPNARSVRAHFRVPSPVCPFLREPPNNDACDSSSGCPNQTHVVTPACDLPALYYIDQACHCLAILHFRPCAVGHVIHLSLVLHLVDEHILPLIPQFVSLPSDKFQVVLTRILQDSPQSGDSLTPAEILISIHGIDSEKDGVPLKKIMDACSACFEQRLVFTQQVLAKVLNQLVEQIPLPLLFMRTVIQAIGVFPGLVDFVMEILSRLVSKQIWKYPKLWVGFLKCALQTKPQSFNVLLQLPAAQLENALSKNPVLKSPLMEHANQPNIRSTLPRSSLVVLGLANDTQRLGQVSQTSGQVQQISQNQAADTASSTADPAAEITQ